MFTGREGRKDGEEERGREEGRREDRGGRERHFAEEAAEKRPVTHKLTQPMPGLAEL